MCERAGGARAPTGRAPAPDAPHRAAATEVGGSEREAGGGRSGRGGKCGSRKRRAPPQPLMEPRNGRVDPADDELETAFEGVVGFQEKMSDETDDDDDEMTKKKL